MALLPDKSGPPEAYFTEMQAALKQAGVFGPTLVIDKARLMANVSQLQASLPPGLGLRIVSKSLPVPEVLRAVSDAADTKSYMTFNAPMLLDVAQMEPGAHQLLGKPLPVAAAAHVLDTAPHADICWLIDTVPRLQAYAELARLRETTLSVALEIDIGLHRGGFTPHELAEAATVLKDTPHLTFQGLMGYDAHLGKAPTFGGIAAAARRKSQTAYRAALGVIQECLGLAPADIPIRNGGGSPTFQATGNIDILSEVSVGSALVKPTDFDLHNLSTFQPACFIATPALKVLGPMTMPVLERLDGLKRWIDPNLAQTVFVHGGYWKAKPVHPRGLRYHAGYGRSSNQEVLTGGRRMQITTDDFVFFRPTQSEAVLLHFGEIAVVEAGRVTEWWAPFPVSA